MSPLPLHRLLVLGALLLLAACQGVPFSPITEPPTHRSLPGKIVWHDLVTPDVAAARAFYGALFGWQFEARSGYTVIRHGGRSIGGMVSARGRADTGAARWVISLSVDDVDAAVARATAAGGKLLLGVMDVPQRGRFALISDNRGAQLGLLRSASGDPLDVPPASGDWLWNELWSNDLSASLAFYQALAAYQVEAPTAAADQRSEPYRVLSRDGKWRVGIGQIPWQDVHDQWLPYVRVDDVAALTARVEPLGGRVIMQSDAATPGNPRALVADPAGAVLIIEEWAPVAAEVSP